jgi:RNA polymerase sigma-70 factor (ECF subfamily)
MACTASTAFESDVVSQIPALRRFAHRFCRNRDEIDDLVQETILKALGAVHLFAEGSNLKSWMFTIMRNVHNSRFVKDKRMVTGVEDLEHYMCTVKPSQEWHMRCKELTAALNTLPKVSREAVKSVLIDGDSYEAAAEKCGCALGTVKSRVNRARLHLASRLGDTVETAAVA